MQWSEKKEDKTETAYVMVNCESGAELKVMEELGSIDGVKEIKYTFGSYDIVTKVEVSSVELLREIIASRIRKIVSVRSTTTLICKDTILPLQKIMF
jgi:DNA-binding Lrp family transcriptional regulator